MTSLPKPPTSDWPRQALYVLLALVAVKSLWFAADHTLRVYMGDSMVYLQTAAHLTGTGGRSFLYGWVLRFTAFPFVMPESILVVQMAWSVLTCMALYVFTRYCLGAPFLHAALPACVLATEPAQLFMERMVMAETLGLLAFVVTILVFSRYLATGSLRWYLLACFGGLAAAAFRTSYLPVAIGLSVLAPLAHAFLPGGPSASGPHRLRQLAAAFLILLASHTAYTQAYGWATKHPPGYLAYTGMMRIGLVAPLIRAEHFEGTGVSGDILSEVKRPLDDHWQRGHHIWMADGLWPVIQRHSDQPELVARTITRRAMLDDPLGLLDINIRTLGGYFDRNRVHWRMLDDKGVIAPSDRDLALIREWTGWDATGIDATETPARRFFASSTPWLTLCLFALAPLAILTALRGWHTGRRRDYLLLAFASLGLVANHLLFAHIVSFRYLHPFPWFVLANLVAISSAGRLSRAPRHARDTRDTPAS